MTFVNMKKEVDCVTLEKALLEAAKEMGWKAKVKEKFRRGYSLSSGKETQSYVHTRIKLKGRILPAMEIYFKKENLWFEFGGDWPFSGIASKGKIKKYLNTVSENLQTLTA